MRIFLTSFDMTQPPRLPSSASYASSQQQRLWTGPLSLDSANPRSLPTNTLNSTPSQKILRAGWNVAPRPIAR